MYAFEGKADIQTHGQLSANDPKQTVGFGDRSTLADCARPGTIHCVTGEVTRLPSARERELLAFRELGVPHDVNSAEHLSVSFSYRPVRGDA